MNTDCPRPLPASSWHRHTKRTLLGTVSALGLAVVIAASLGAPSAAAKPRHTKEDQKGKEPSKQPSKEPFGNIPKGPLQIFISINQQKLHLYSDGQPVTTVPVATGVPGHLTPMGVFSVIEKDRNHHSNIYSNAPMPYMQRITWSGVAMHEGPGVGHQASHGCIRMPHDFAAKLWMLTKLGVRVVIARNELVPVDFSDSHLFVHKEMPPQPIAGNLPADNGIRTAQAIDASKATDAIVVPLRGVSERRPETGLSTMGGRKLPESVPADAELAGAAAAATKAAATAPERAGASADAASPAKPAAEIDPSLVDDGKRVAQGVATSGKAEDGAPAPTADADTTGTIVPLAPAEYDPASTAVPAPAARAAFADQPSPQPTPPEALRAEQPKAEPPVIAAPATLDPVKTPEPAKAEIPAASPGSAAELQVPPIIAPEDVPVPPARPVNFAKMLAERAGPIAIFISRKEGRIYVRRRFEPLFDAPISIENPKQPLGTHVFTAMEYQGDDSTFRWNVVTLPGEQLRVDHRRDEGSVRSRRHHEPEPAKMVVDAKPPQTAREVLARIQIPQDVIDHIQELIIPGSSLIISDQGLGPETGRGTDFIVVTR